MKKFIQKLFPGDSLKAILIVVGINAVAYYLPKVFVVGDYHLMGNSLDAKIPFIPVFILVYYAAFFQWAYNYIVVAHQDNRFLHKYLLAEVFGLVISMLFFIFYPTTMDRGDLQLNGVLGFLIKFIYSVDEPTNLFPSLHVYRSYMCTRAALKANGVSKFYRVFQVILTALVCFAIVFVKQHVVVDIFGGLILGELTVQISKFIFNKFESKGKAFHK